MNICDQGGCTARATTKVTFDNGYSLWACSHDCRAWFPWLPHDVRFDLQAREIVT